MRTRVHAVAVAALVLSCAAGTASPPRPQAREHTVPFSRVCVEACDSVEWARRAQCYSDCILDLKTWKVAPSTSEWCTKPKISCTDTPGPRVKWEEKR